MVDERIAALPLNKRCFLKDDDTVQGIVIAIGLTSWYCGFVIRDTEEVYQRWVNREEIIIPSEEPEVWQAYRLQHGLQTSDK